MPRDSRTKEKTVVYQEGNHPGNECYWLLNSYTFKDLGIWKPNKSKTFTTLINLVLGMIKDGKHNNTISRKVESTKGQNPNN